jgi:hypothetical protein
MHVFHLLVRTTLHDGGRNITDIKDLGGPLVPCRTETIDETVTGVFTAQYSELIACGE